MTAGLETFAKVRALHDGTTNPGEKASAAARMQTLARKAGMSVEEAMSKLDAPKPATSHSFFEDLFNTPEFRAQHAKRECERAERRAAALGEYGSEDTVWEPNEWEQALEEACLPVVVRKPIIGGEMDTLQGWSGGQFDRMPPDVQAVVASAYPLPTTMREAWAEWRFWVKLGDDRTAFYPDYDHDVRIRARGAYLEHLLDTLPARSMNDLRARLDWMDQLNEQGFSRDIHEDTVLLATLRADIERMGERLREQSEGDVSTSPTVQSGQSGNRGDGSPKPGNQSAEVFPKSGATLGSPDPATSTAPIQSGHPRRTNADKRRDVLVLLDIGKSDNAGLSDREIARRAGVSPTTVGTIRRSLA